MSENRYVTEESLIRFQGFLQQERSAGTIEKYMRDVKNFAAWIEDQSSVPSGFSCCEVTKDTAVRWKQYLLQSGRAPSTVNSMLAAVKTYFKFMCWQDLRIKAIRLQKSFFRSSDRELKKTEYEKLISAARRKGDEQMVLLMETICATGIRVSEVRYITREAAAKGRTQISLKGKLRTILIPGQLCRKLQKYARKKGIGSGELFLTTVGQQVSPGKRCFLIICVISLPGVFTVLPVTFRPSPTCWATAASRPRGSIWYPRKMFMQKK